MNTANENSNNKRFIRCLSASVSIWFNADIPLKMVQSESAAQASAFNSKPNAKCNDVIDDKTAFRDDLTVRHSACMCNRKRNIFHRQPTAAKPLPYDEQSIAVQCIPTRYGLCLCWWIFYAHFRFSRAKVNRILHLNCIWLVYYSVFCFCLLLVPFFSGVCARVCHFA